MAISRYDLRKTSERAAAIAIAVEYTRADLFPPSDPAKARDLLKKYLDQRVLFYTIRDDRQLLEIQTDTAQLQNQLWSGVRVAIAAVLPPLEGAVVSGMNDVVASQMSSQASEWNHIPVSVWLLMVIISIGCSFLIGFRARRTDWLLFIVMPMALSISFFQISDLDTPRSGATQIMLLMQHKSWPAILEAGLAGFAVYDIQESLPVGFDER